MKLSGNSKMRDFFRVLGAALWDTIKIFVTDVIPLALVVFVAIRIFFLIHGALFH